MPQPLDHRPAKSHPLSTHAALLAPVYAVSTLQLEMDEAVRATPLIGTWARRRPPMRACAFPWHTLGV